MALMDRGVHVVGRPVSRSCGDHRYEPALSPVSGPRRANAHQTVGLQTGPHGGQPASDGGHQRCRGFRAGRPAPRPSASAAAATRRRRPTVRQAGGCGLPMRSAPAERPGRRGTDESAAVQYRRMRQEGWGHDGHHPQNPGGRPNSPRTLTAAAVSTAGAGPGAETVVRAPHDDAKCPASSITVGWRRGGGCGGAGEPHPML